LADIHLESLNLLKLDTMDAIIKIRSSEFNEELFKKIKDLIKQRDAFVTIAVHDRDSSAIETNEEYLNRLDKSVLDIESGEGKTFTMKELESFIKE